MQTAHRHQRRDRRVSWTQAQLRELRQRWSRGVPASQIARALGGGISRNAVLAKVRRLGLAARRTHERRPSARSTIRAISFDAIPDRLRPRKHHSNREQPRYPTWVIAASPYVEDPGLDAAIPVPQRRTLIELSGQTCRWPVGDPASPDFFFCGGATHDAHPYCRDHCARAYQPPYSPA